MKRFGVLVGVCLLLRATVASAASFTLTFDCTIVNTNPATCTPGGSFGSLTLSDSLVNPNRVDFAITLNAAAMPGVTGLDTLFLNYNNAVTVGGATNRVFGMVAQSAAVGDHTSAGNTGINFNNLGPFATTLDLSLDPSLNPGLSYLGSLVVYSTQSGHAESNLDAIMFKGKDADNLLYAAFNTLPGNQNQQYGATSLLEASGDPTAVPEPASLLLLGSGLSVVARRMKK